MGVNYCEASYFDGAHFKHIADWLEHRRLRRILVRELSIINANEGDKNRARRFATGN